MRMAAGTAVQPLGAAPSRGTKVSWSIGKAISNECVGLTNPIDLYARACVGTRVVIM
jgi:hypothetical protein